jgi:hypothetical protein
LEYYVPAGESLVNRIEDAAANYSAMRRCRERLEAERAAALLTPFPVVDPPPQAVDDATAGPETDDPAPPDDPAASRSVPSSTGRATKQLQQLAKKTRSSSSPAKRVGASRAKYLELQRLVRAHTGGSR